MPYAYMIETLYIKNKKHAVGMYLSVEDASIHKKLHAVGMHPMI